MRLQNSTLRLHVTLLIGYFVSAISAFLLAMLLVPAESRSVHFWPRVLWTEFLILLVWAYFGGYVAVLFSKDDRIRGLGGIMPALGIIVFSYAIMSFALMLVSAYLPPSDWAGRIHMAGQVVRFAGAVVIGVFLCFSLFMARHGAEPIPNTIESPSQLAQSLRFQENRLSTSDSNRTIERRHDLLKAIKSLREKITYSLQHVGAIGQNQHYRDFSHEISLVCEKLGAIDLNASESSVTAANLVSEMAVLHGRVDMIATQIRRG